jgi:hypothetical protein
VCETVSFDMMLATCFAAINLVLLTCGAGKSKKKSTFLRVGGVAIGSWLSLINTVNYKELPKGSCCRTPRHPSPLTRGHPHRG